MTTADGYILSLQRVQRISGAAGRPVVFLQHGLVDAAATWIMNGSHSLSEYRIRAFLALVIVSITLKQNCTPVRRRI